MKNDLRITYPFMDDMLSLVNHCDCLSSWDNSGYLKEMVQMDSRLF